MQSIWTKRFDLKPKQIITVPLFNEAMYMSWKEYVVPLFQADYKNKNYAQRTQMYNACIDMAQSEYSLMCKDSNLKLHLDELLTKSKYLGP